MILADLGQPVHQVGRQVVAADRAGGGADLRAGAVGRQLQRGEVARESPHRLGARAVASVHAERQSDHQPGDLLFGDEGLERFEVS